jgi:hypothetical protein
VNFLWWFMQGSLMDADVRRALWRGWGMCERHALAWLQVEAAFRRGYLHGPAIVYAELMERARAVVERGGRRRARRALQAQAPCHLCDLGYGPASPGHAPAARMLIGGDPTRLRAFIVGSRGEWTRFVCGRCIGSQASARCRIHLIEALAKGTDDAIDEQRRLVRAIAAGAERYQASFIWERRGTDTAADRGGFVAAVGWCSGWRLLLDMVDGALQEAG